MSQFVLLFQKRILLNINFDKLKRMLSLAEQRICIYCSFCKPVRSVVSKENFVLKTVYTGHWNKIRQSSPVDVIEKGQLRWSKAAEKRSQ